MKESDAKTKWCPFTGDLAGTTRAPGVDAVYPAARCIGSECMAWRWFDLDNEALAGRGYCGLAGRQ